MPAETPTVMSLKELQEYKKKLTKCTARIDFLIARHKEQNKKEITLFHFSNLKSGLVRIESCLMSGGDKSLFVLTHPGVEGSIGAAIRDEIRDKKRKHPPGSGPGRPRKRLQK